MGPILTRPSRGQLIGAAIFGLLAGGFLFFPAFVMQWQEGLLPFSPYRSRPAQQAPAAGWPKVDVSREQFVLTWPKGESATDAPPLSLRILPTDWYAWWSEGRREQAVRPDGPDGIQLDVTVPNAEGILPETMDPPCQLAVDPAGGCSAARARVRVSRDGGQFDILLGKGTPQQQTRITNDGRNVPVIHEFWTRRDEGRERFLGWACPAGAKNLPLDPVSGGRPEALYQCFAPTGWFESRWPGWFGYEKRKVYADCVQQRCEMLFLFAGRQVTMDFELLPARDIETARYRLLLAAWETLNRQRQDADQPVPPARELAQARVQLATCQATAEDIGRFSRDQLARMSDLQRHRVSMQQLSCEQAAQIAARMAKSSPREAEPVLAGALDAMTRMGSIRGHGDALFDAWFAALDGMGRGESVEALRAGLIYVERGPRFAKDDPRNAARDERVVTTRALLTRLGLSLTEPERVAAYRAFTFEYYGDEHRQDMIALLQEQVAVLARQHGETSREVLQPLIDLVTVQSLAGDFDGLRRTLDQLHAAWDAQATPEAVVDPKAKQLIANGGLHVVYGLRLLAWHDQSGTAMAPKIDETLMTMRALLGPDDPFVRGAEFHRKEVLSGNFVPTLPGGGMYGTPHY